MVPRFILAVSLVVAAVGTASVLSDSSLRERVREAEQRSADRDSWRMEAENWRLRFEAELNRRDQYEVEVVELRKRLESITSDGGPG